MAARVAEVSAHVVRQKTPLRLFIPFGGYKSPASSEFPNASWAEVFTVAGMCELVSPICAVHPPGVIVEFSSDEAVVPIFMGAKRKFLDQYHQKFECILNELAKFQRGKLILKQSLLYDHYNIDRLSCRINRRSEVLKHRWFPMLAPEEKRRLLGAAERNYFSSLPKDSRIRQEILTRSLCQHQAYLEIDNVERAPILFAPDTVPIALRRGLESGLHLGSNRRSAVQFWVGAGYWISVSQLRELI